MEFPVKSYTQMKLTIDNSLLLLLWTAISEKNKGVFLFISEWIFRYPWWSFHCSLYSDWDRKSHRRYSSMGREICHTTHAPSRCVPIRKQQHQPWLTYQQHLLVWYEIRHESLFIWATTKMMQQYYLWITDNSDNARQSTNKTFFDSSHSLTVALRQAWRQAFCW